MQQPKVTSCTVLLLVSTLWSEGGQAESQTGAVTLSLGDYLSAVEKHDPELARLRALREQSTFEKELVLTPSVPRLLNQSQTGLSLDGGDAIWSTDTSLEKPFPDSGTRLVLSHEWGEEATRETSTLSFTLEQEFWRNAFGKQEDLESSGAALRGRIRDLEISESYEDRLSELLGNFLDYQELLILEKNLQRQREDARRREELVRRKARSAIANPTDLARAKLAVLRKETEIATLTSQKNAAKTIIHAATGMDLRPLDELKNFSPEPLLEGLSLGKSHPLRRQEKIALRLDLASLDLKLADSEMEPRLAGFVGARTEESTAFGTESVRNDLLIGAKIDLELGRDSRKEAQKSQALHDKLLAEKEGVLEQTKFLQGLESLKAALIREQELIKLSSEVLDGAQTIAREEARRYQTGRSDLDRLIEAETVVTQSEAQWLRHHITLRKLALDYLAFTDQLWTGNQETKGFPWSAFD